MPTVNEAKSFLTGQNSKRDAKSGRGKGENRTSWADVNEEQEREPQAGGAMGPRGEGEMA